MAFRRKDTCSFTILSMSACTLLKCRTTYSHDILCLYKIHSIHMRQSKQDFDRKSPHLLRHTSDNSQWTSLLCRCHLNATMQKKNRDPQAQKRCCLLWSFKMDWDGELHPPKKKKSFKINKFVKEWVCHQHTVSIHGDKKVHW